MAYIFHQTNTASGFVLMILVNHHLLGGFVLLDWQGNLSNPPVNPKGKGHPRYTHCFQVVQIGPVLLIVTGDPIRCPETEICKPETEICKPETEISKQETEISAPRTK
jgi:hypothetical protein